MVDDFIAHCYTEEINYLGKYSKKETFQEFTVCGNTETNSMFLSIYEVWWIGTHMRGVKKDSVMVCNLIILEEIIDNCERCEFQVSID